MEVAKFKAIVARVKSGELDRAYYVNFIGDDTAYIYKFGDIIQAGIDGKVEIGYQYAPRATAVNSEKTVKRVMYLPKSIGTKLTRVDNRWIINN